MSIPSIVGGSKAPADGIHRANASSNSKHEVKKSFFGKIKDLAARVVRAIVDFFKTIGAFFKRLFCCSSAPAKPQSQASSFKLEKKPPPVSAGSKTARISEVGSKSPIIFEDPEQIKEVKALAPFEEKGFIFSGKFPHISRSDLDPQEICQIYSMICAYKGLDNLERMVIEQGFDLTEKITESIAVVTSIESATKMEFTKAAPYLDSVREEFPQFEMGTKFTPELLSSPGKMTRFVCHGSDKINTHFGLLDMRDKSHPVGYFGSINEVSTDKEGDNIIFTIGMTSPQQIVDFLLKKQEKEKDGFTLFSLDKRGGEKL